MFLAMAILASLSVGRAQDNPASAGDYVSRAEYDKVKAEHEAMKQEVDELKATVKQLTARAAQAPAPVKTAPEGKQVVGTPEAATEELRQEVETLKTQVEETRPGTTKFLLTGYAFGGFEKREGQSSTFTAGLAPIFLWQLSDKLFFEGEVTLELKDTEMEVGLEYAQLTYLLNNYMTVGAGKFLTPFDQFPERLHPPWINKLPDFPLVFNEDEGLVPFSQ